MSKKQIKREIHKLQHRLEEIERNKITKRINTLDETCSEFCDKYPQYSYDKELRMLSLDTMYTFNGAKDTIVIAVNYNKRYIYISPYYLDVKYWEHRPKCLRDGITISLDMSNKYFKNTLLKILKRVHQWHRSRPLHDKYKACNNTTY